MTISRARVRGLLVGGLVAFVVVAVSPASPAAADRDRPSYVAIGDSYSAGVGTHGPITDSTCYRSPLGYPALVAQQAHWRLDYQACSGATTSSVFADQLKTLSPETDVVTIGVGGNDVGFMPVMTACAFGAPGDCELALAGAHQALSILPDSLDWVYGTVAANAPNAKVAVVGYPHLFDRRDCSPLIDVTRLEMRSLNVFTDELDAVLRNRAQAAGFRYIDVREEFAGHAICTPKPYINTYVPDQVWMWDSFHPNRDGYAAYAREVSAALTHGDRS